MDQGQLMYYQPTIVGMGVPRMQEGSHPDDEQQQLARLRVKVAALLNREQYAVQCLSAKQCHSIIDTLRKVQQARDKEILQMLKPYIDSLGEVIPRFNVWKRFCHQSAFHQPHAELIHRLDTPVKTELGMKPGSFSLVDDVLHAIEASNKILRALAIEKNYLGLSKPMKSLKSNVQEMMLDVQRLLSYIIDAREPVPGGRFRSSDVLDAEKGQIVLRRGRPFYVDPRNGDLVICEAKHPLLRAPGSEWNKWLRTPLVTLSDFDSYMSCNIPDGPFRHLRDVFAEARHILHDNMAARSWAFDGDFQTDQQETEFNEYCRTHIGAAADQGERAIDLDHVKPLEWDMSTYVKMLEHKEVEYARNGSPKPYDKGFWWNITRGADVIHFLHPGYCNLVSVSVQRIDHPCEFELFEQLEVDFSKMKMTPEEANGVLTPYMYEDGATGDDFEDEPEEVEDIPLGQFSQEGLYLDTRRDWMRVKAFNFIRPDLQRRY